MRTVIVLAVALLATVAFVSAADNEVDTEVEQEVDTDSELAVPTLPGLGMGCLPTYAKRDYRQRSWRHQPRRRIVAFGGKCVADSTCPEASQEHGYCAGIGTVCCKTGAVSANPAAQSPVTVPSSAGPVLRAGATACQTKYSTAICKDVATCGAGNTPVSGLCPGLSNIKCCVPNGALNPPTPVGTSMSTLIRIPAGINAGLSMAGASFNNANVGSPGCPLTAACFSCACATSNSLINKLKVTLPITPNMRITGLRPFVEAVKRAFDAMLAASATRPELKLAYDQVKSAGGLCCRPIKRSNGTPGSSYSNHSWGMAVDFYFGASIDPRGDGKTQYGLSLMAPFLQAEKLYWAAGFSGSEEDAMHFESSQQSLNAWKAAGLLR